MSEAETKSAITDEYVEERIAAAAKSAREFHLHSSSCLTTCVCADGFM